MCNREWNYRKLITCLPAHICKLIAAIPIGGNDSPYWKASSSQDFTTKSARHLCRIQQDVNPVLSSLWHSSIPIKISVVSWRLLNDLLPVDLRMRAFGIQGASKCHCCNAEESIDHVFLHSPAASTVWSWYTMLFNLPYKQFSSPQALLRGWSFTKNVPSRGNIKMITALIIFWAIWGARNSAKHEKIPVQAGSIILKVKRKIHVLICAKRITFKNCIKEANFCEEFGISTVTKSRSQLHCIRWMRPSQNWVKLNIDGCSKGNPGLAGAGGIFRDSQGKVICSFYMNLGFHLSDMAELIALLQGVKIISLMGFTKVWIESDSLTLVNQINQSYNGTWNTHMYFSVINSVLSKVFWQISHIWREANAAADFLANKGLLANALFIDVSIHQHGLLRGITMLDRREYPYIRKFVIE